MSAGAGDTMDHLETGQTDEEKPASLQADDLPKVQFVQQIFFNSCSSVSTPVFQFSLSVVSGLVWPVTCNQPAKYDPDTCPALLANQALPQ